MCRVNTPTGFLKSPYWWCLELDRYAVDGKLFQPSWMAQGPVCEKPPFKKASCDLQILIVDPTIHSSD
jgi:hypothetical protein